MKFQSHDISATDYLTQFDEAKNNFNPSSIGLREKAISDFRSLGFPTTKNEEWKYTNVNPILKNKFTKAGQLQLTEHDIKKFLPGNSSEIVLVFENGKWNKNLSHLNNIPAGLTIGSIEEFADHSVVQSHFGKIAKNNEESFLTLNTAMFPQGAFVYADSNYKSEACIHLLFINDSRQNSTVSFPRNFIFASKGITLRIVENYYSIDSHQSSFCNSVSEIFIDDNAHVELCKVESEGNEDFHIDYTAAALQKDSSFHIHTITTSGKIVRNNLRIELQKLNGSAYLNGLYITNGNSHVDNHSVVDHASPNCYSNELYKGVLNGASHGIFNGKIFVHRDAQKTNAYQSNKNILLSDDASINAKPQLEIYADDVKCSHGATTGQLDAEAMFYLRSRGIGENEARSLLTAAFAQDILDRISIESEKERLSEIVQSALKRGNQ